MKISVLQDNLSKGLSVVSRAVATRTTLPITQNVLLETDESRLKLSATNLEIAVCTWIGGKIENPGTVTVPAKLLTDFIGSLSGDRIEMETTKNDGGLQLKCGRVEANVNGTESSEFPPIPKVDEGVKCSIDSAALISAIDRVAFAAATDDSRPVLTGVKVDIKDRKFTLAAADGFRLAVYTGTLKEKVTEPVSSIVPAKTLYELSRLLPGQEEAVEIVFSSKKSQVLFKLKNIEIVSQLIQGSFPNYSQLVPKEHSTRARVPLDGLLNVAKTASIFAKDGSGIVRLQIISGDGDGDGKIQVISKAEEIGDNQGELDAKVEGPDSKIAFNSKYLLDVLGILGTEDAVLDVTTPSNPGVFRSGESDEYVHVIMPMFVQW
jgi:DNA polymerase-3 subunit beta